MSRSAPHDQALATALDRSEPLAGLMQRVQESRRRFEAIAALLPPGLRTGTRAGPLDDSAWVLLSANAAAAAKLRQLLPRIQEDLLAAGWPQREIRIKVRAPEAR